MQDMQPRTEAATVFHINNKILTLLEVYKAFETTKGSIFSKYFYHNETHAIYKINSIYHYKLKLLLLWNETKLWIFAHVFM